MRTAETSGSGLLTDGQNLATAIVTGSTDDPGRVVLSRAAATGWDDIDLGRLRRDLSAFAAGLLARGVEPGDRIGVLGPTDYAWVVAAFAAWQVGAVLVPVYPTASVTQIRHIVAAAGVSACFAGTPALAKTLHDAGTSLAADRIWLLDDERLIDDGQRVPPGAVADRGASVGSHDLAAIVFTSGTTGLSKGTMLTHGNVFAAAAGVVEACWPIFRLPDGAPASTLLFLPLSHVYGLVTLVGCLWARVRTGLVGDAAALIGSLGTFRPTFLVVVPYALEKMRKTVEAAGNPPPDQVRAMLGGRLADVICGGASLEESTGRFFAGFGVTVLGAYGLTESAAAVSVNPPDAHRLGSAGRPIPGTEVTIADDGEILVRGPQVSAGYWPPAGDGSGAAAAGGSGPAADFPRDDDGWLATGDLGRLDDGYLFITGRRKEILVTSGGKNVAPAPLEDRIRLHPLVSNCIVLGEGRSYVTALITLDPRALAAWSAARGGATSDATTPADAVPPHQNPAVTAAVATAVDAANALVSRAESIRRFQILPADFSVADGHLTPTLKLRRAVIAEDFRTVIEALYTA
ncbi:MAG: AMP-dependent synthetase/ligase [Frankia sp.]